MAVMVSGSTISNLRKQIVNPRIQLLLQANKDVKLGLYYFSLKDIKLGSRTIKGLYWDDKKDIWLSKEFEFPDILYLRGGTPKKYTLKFNKFRTLLRKRRAKIINYPRFDKWHLYQIISNDPILRSYVPFTLTFNKLHDIKKMLQKYKTIYLKSHSGRKGKYVIRVEDLFDGVYLYSYYKCNTEELVVKRASGFEALLEIIFEFFQDRRFIIQQAIKLPKFENSLIDMRAELQRNGQGTLEITGISVRMGKQNSPITTHEDAYRFEYFYKEILHYHADRLEELQNRVHQFLFHVYDCIERNYGKYVEIGIDFAIDTKGKIWFIESNSQSTKQSLGKAYGDEVLFKAYKNILEYARYVAYPQPKFN